MGVKERRQNILKAMDKDSYMVLFAGQAVNISSDTYHPFKPNTNFFYLTDIINRHSLVLVLDSHGEGNEILFIPRIDPFVEKWNGKQLKVEEAKEITGISDIRFLDQLDMYLHMIFNTEDPVCYFDLYQPRVDDLLKSYNYIKANMLKEKYPQLTLKNAWPLIAYERMAKDEAEIEKLKTSIDITKKALEYVMSTVKPGMLESQVQANFEYMIHYNGADEVSFDTIAGSGYNGTMLHYHANNCVCNDNELILLDLGARKDGYCADITRTYPINGKFTPRQKQIYDIVLKANRTVLQEAKPGMSTTDLNDICKRVLAQGCKEIGLIKEDKELFKYYMHGVSHHLGIDTHDVNTGRNAPLRPGSVVSDEPGLYIEEESIGIRIEDDIMITEDGAICLSADIIRTTEEIEDFMAKNNK